MTKGKPHDLAAQEAARARVLRRGGALTLVGAFVFFSVASSGIDPEEPETPDESETAEPSCEARNHCRLQSDGTPVCEDGYRWRSASDLVCEPDIPAANSRWTITFVNARIADQDPNGAAWDALGGAPDPLACVTVGTAAQVCTSTKQDTFAPAWNEVTPSYGYNQLGDVEIELFDEDISDYEWIAGWSGPLQPAISGRAETVELTDGRGTSLKLTIAPAN